MNWLQIIKANTVNDTQLKEKARPPRILIAVHTPGYIKVLVGDKYYEYEATGLDVKRIENFIRKGFRGRALQYLRNLKRIVR